jgi:AraC-like DNA-binding protein
MNGQIRAIALDYGGYAVSQLSDEPATVLVLQRGQVPDHGPPGGPAQPRDLAATAGTAGEPAAGCPVCGGPAGFPPFPPPAPAHLDACAKRRAREAARTARVIAWMAANCHRPDVTVAEIAEVAGVGTNRLHVLFRRDFGRSPLRLLRDMGLHQVHLGLTGHAPAPASIAEAARQAGYSRADRFRAAYRGRYGTDPALPGPAEPEDGRKPAQ